MALCYSTAEYCAPVWARSAHTRLVDTQLNTTMRIISGTFRATPLPWLPVLSNIPPPTLRRQEATVNILQKAMANDLLPLNADINQHPPVRLSSRKPVWLDPPPETMTAISVWDSQWQTTDVVNHSLIAVPSVRPPGFDLPRLLWSTLNRFRTGQGRCAATLAHWGQCSDSSCNCGAPQQTMNHIVNECPFTAFPGGLEALHLADEEAVHWLRTVSIR